MPKEGLGDDGSFDGILDVYMGMMLTCCAERLEVLPRRMDVL